MARYYDHSRLVQEVLSGTDDDRTDAAIRELVYRQQQSAAALSPPERRRAQAARLAEANDELHDFHRWVKKQIGEMLVDWHKRGLDRVKAQLTHGRVWANELDAARKITRFSQLSDRGFYLQSARALIGFTGETISQSGDVTVNFAGLPSGNQGSIADLMHLERRKEAARTIGRCERLQHDSPLDFEIFLLRRFAGRHMSEVSYFIGQPAETVRERYDQTAAMVDAR